MSLGRLRSSISIATETSFGSLSATTGIPDTSALSYAAAEIMRESVNYDGQEEPMVDRMVASAYPAESVPEPLTVYAGRSPVQRRTGEITLRFRGIHCAGNGSVTNLTIPTLLRTVMRSTSPVTGDTDTVAAGAPTSNTFPATTPGKYSVGQMIATVQANRISYAWVTDVTAGTVTFSPSFPTLLQVGDTIRMVRTYYPTLGALSFVTHPSISVRQDLHDRRWQAVGCRLKKLTVEMADDRMLGATAVLTAPWIQDADGSASPLVVPAMPGPYAKAVQTYDVYSSLAAVSTPADAIRTAMESRRWTIDIEFDLVPQSRSDSGLTMSDYHCNGFRVSVSQTVSPITLLESGRLAREQYHLLLGAGPTSAPDGAGLGWAFGVKAAFLNSYVKPAVSDAETVHELTWVPGPWERESGGPWVPTSPIDAPWTLGWVV